MSKKLSCHQNEETATRYEDVSTEATDQEPIFEQRKRLTIEEITAGFEKVYGNEFYDPSGFVLGVLFAEKHHGISK